MASRYIQKYPVPEGFALILKNFSRQILRDQPTNIIEYSANYFQALQSGRQFHYQSQFNVPKHKKDYQLQYNPVKAESMVRKDKRINEISGAIDSKQMQKITKVVDNVFLKYDHNKNGNLEVGQLREMLKEIYKGGQIDALPTEGQIRQFCTHVDTNNNGAISKKELTVFIRKMLV